MRGGPFFCWFFLPGDLIALIALEVEEKTGLSASLAEDDSTKLSKKNWRKIMRQTPVNKRRRKTNPQQRLLARRLGFWVMK